MMMSHHEAEATVETEAPIWEPETTNKAHTQPPKPRVASRKSKAAHKPIRAQGRAKTSKKAKPKPVKVSRQGTKTTRILDLLNRPNGATLKELIKATGWQPHSVRGFLSGTVGKKKGLTVASVRNEDGERRYSAKT